MYLLRALRHNSIIYSFQSTREENAELYDESQLDINQTIIPQNALTKGKLFHIDWIRWVESGIYCLLVSYAIIMTNFVDKIKLISICVLCISGTIFFLHGIKNRSVTQVLFEVIRSRRLRKHYRLGSVNDGRKAVAAIQNNFGGESYWDKFTRRIRYRFDEFDKKYGADDKS